MTGLADQASAACPGVLRPVVGGDVARVHAVVNVQRLVAAPVELGEAARQRGKAAIEAERYLSCK